VVPTPSPAVPSATPGAVHSIVTNVPSTGAELPVGLGALLIIGGVGMIVGVRRRI